MTSPLASSLFAWLLTYLIHSTVLLGGAWLVTRRRRLEPAVTDLLWKVALLASLVTGTMQTRLRLSTPAAVTLPVAGVPRPATPSLPAVPLRDPTADSSASSKAREPAGASASRVPALALVQHLLSGADVSPGDLAKIREMIARVETTAPESQ